MATKKATATATHLTFTSTAGYTHTMPITSMCLVRNPMDEVFVYLKEEPNATYGIRDEDYQDILATLTLSE